MASLTNEWYENQPNDDLVTEPDQRPKSSASLPTALFLHVCPVFILPTPLVKSMRSHTYATAQHRTQSTSPKVLPRHGFQTKSE